MTGTVEPGFDSSRAELFEALGHPVRVKILRALEGGPMSFSELKRETGIESSGHLQFHIGKLDGLVGNDSGGSYVLTDEGREANRILDSTSLEGSVHAKASRHQISVGRALLAGLLIALVLLAGVAVYQEQQIAVLSHSLNAAAVEIGGTRYYYESVPTNLPNGSSIVFHGLTFTTLQAPLFCYSNPTNYTFACSVRLSNGTLLDLAGKTVIIEENGGIFKRLSSGNGTLLNYGTVLNTGIAITFPDGSRETYNGFNITARFQRAYNLIVGPVVVLTYTYLPSSVNPWFGEHPSPQVGVFWNYGNSTGNQNTFTLYVSESS